MKFTLQTIKEPEQEEVPTETSPPPPQCLEPEKASEPEPKTQEDSPEAQPVTQQPQKADGSNTEKTGEKVMCKCFLFTVMNVPCCEDEEQYKTSLLQTSI